MHLYIDYRTDGESLYDYRGEDFLSAEDAYDFAEATAQTLNNKLDGDWKGWSIEVRNAEGKMYFSIPVGNSTTSLGKIDQSSNEGPCDGSETRVDEFRTLLIIEDALIHSAVVHQVARKLGFVTAKAYNFRDACSALGTTQFDCITLDLVLGEHVGLDVLRHLAAIGCRAPIIVISQSDKDTCDDIVQLGKALGLNVCESIQKPIDLDRLRGMLGNIQTHLRS